MAEHQLEPLESVGMDEVGRGALAGPVVVAAVSLKDGHPATIAAAVAEYCGMRQLKDSKQLSRANRAKVAQWVREHLPFGIGEAEAAEIDHFGISAALTLAAERAMAALKKKDYWPESVDADAGLHHPFEATIPTTHTVKGDEQIISIMLASNLAKDYRDGQMLLAAETYPDYFWETNMGYGSGAHIHAIAQSGASPLHRKSFLK